MQAPRGVEDLSSHRTRRHERNNLSLIFNWWIRKAGKVSRAQTNPNQLWRSGGQHLCFSGYKFLSIRRTGAQQRLEYPGSGSVPDGGRAYPHKSAGRT